MKVFVTGASGWIGSVTTKELISHGHKVLGLARSDASADLITSMGGSVLRGKHTDLNILQEGAKTSDAVIHLAFRHDFSGPDDYTTANQEDRDAITAIGEALKGSNKPFIIASGTLGMQPGQISTEDTMPIDHPLAVRHKAADIVHELSKNHGVKGMVVRLPPSVHGAGDKGFVTMLGGAAKNIGFATYIDDGSARWPTVHRLDAAVLFRLAAEKGRAGAVYNAIAEQGIPMKEIMTLVGKKVGVPAESKTMQEAEPLLHFFAYVISMDNPASSEKTKKELGWEPKEVTLLKDIEENYFV